MIQKEGDVFTLTCDICGTDAPEFFDSFEEAVVYKTDSDNGWVSRKNPAGDWEEICPDCQ